MKRRNVIFIGLGVVVVLAVAGYFFMPRILQLSGITTGTSTSATSSGTAQVSSLTVINTIEAAGSVEALQTESLSWKTTGTVSNVNVSVGDKVKKGEVLMEIDPLTAPQSVVEAQIELVTAQEALEALLNPSELEIATAQQAVTTAEQTLEDAQITLKYTENPLGESLYEAVDDAKLALDNALGNQELERVSSDASSVKTTLDDMNLAYSRVQRAQVAMDDCIKISCGERVARENELNNAQKAYQTAWDAYQTAKLQYDMNVASQTDTVETAQSDYDDAVANLNAALLGPDALELKAAQDAVAVAEADLADKQATLDKLINGADRNDVAEAQATVLAAQATLETLYIKAPFDGDVLQVNYQTGNTASTSDVALIIADRSQMYVDVSVDEADISQLDNGDVATISFDSLPDLTLTGKVTQISAVGEEVSGLVKYTARVTFDQTDPSLRLGMTTSASIVTETIEGALAVPIDAVQEDDQGEYVIRVQGGSTETVRVVSGTVQDDDLVLVTGDLQAGDTVQVGTSTTTTSSEDDSAQQQPGGGGIPGLDGGGGGGAPPAGGGPGGG